MCRNSASRSWPGDRFLSESHRPPGGDRDRRQVAIAGTVTVYLVSAGVLVVTVVRIVH
jgi:hypothetical protein